MPLEIQERMAKNQRFPYVLHNVDDYNAPSILNGMDIGWTTEKIDYEGAPSAWLSINGKIGTEKSDPRYALSLFPYDGLSQLPYYIASVQRHEHKAKLPKKRTLTPNIPVS